MQLESQIERGKKASTPIEFRRLLETLDKLEFCKWFWGNVKAVADELENVRKEAKNAAYVSDSGWRFDFPG